jgi:hypothetical protein
MWGRIWGGGGGGLEEGGRRWRGRGRKDCTALVSGRSVGLQRGGQRGGRGPASSSTAKHGIFFAIFFLVMCPRLCWMPSRFLDRELHAKVKKKAKARFERWPSAYGSAWMTREYLRRGGRLAGNPEQGVGRWMREEWVQVLPYLDHDGRRIPCGDGSKATKKRSRSRKSKVVGPACRPSRRISKRTPITIQEAIKEHGKRKVRSLATKKGRDMDGRADWKRGRFVSSKARSERRSTKTRPKRRKTKTRPRNSSSL